MTLIRRQDVTTTDGVTPEAGVYITVKLMGVIVPLFTDSGASLSNPFQSGSDGSFYYNVSQAGTYTEEYRLTPSGAVKTNLAVALGVTDGVPVVTAEQFGAVGDGVADDTAALKSAALAGLTELVAGKTYKITSTVPVPSNSGFVCPNGKATILMPAANFNNTDNTSAGRYGTNAVGLDLSGGLSTPYTPNSNIRLENLIIKSEVSDGRAIRAIVGRNITGCVIRNIEIFGLPTGIAICLATADNVTVEDFFIHDCTTASTVMGSGALAQITAIEVDNDRINSVGSTDLKIRNGLIRNMTMTGAALAAYGYQTDGINIANQACLRTKISDVAIDTVGEGIDNFGCYGTFENLTLLNCYNYGLKFIHGARFNSAHGVVIQNSGLAGIVFAGSPTANNDTANNLVTGVTIDTLDPNHVWGTSSAGISFIDNTGGVTGLPRDNQVIGVSITPGANGYYGIYNDSTGSGNVVDDADIKNGPVLNRTVYVLNTGAGRVGLKGSSAWFVNTTPTAPVPRKSRVDVTTATYTPSLSEDVLRVTYTATGAVTITLPPAWVGDIIDAGNNASVHNITVQRTPSGSFTASISGTTMTVTATSNTIYEGGGSLTGTGISGTVYVVRQLTGTKGGTGTYEVSTSQTVASTTITQGSEGNIGGRGGSSSTSVISANGGAKFYDYMGRGNGWWEVAVNGNNYIDSSGNFNGGSGTFSGAITVGGTVSLNASGVLQAAAFPALTGDITTSGGSLSTALSSATVVAKVAGQALAPASVTASGTGSFSNILGGTYTPTISNTTNVGASTLYSCQYLRVGNTVTVSGRVSITPSAAGTTLWSFSLPISSTLSAGEYLAGTIVDDTAAVMGRVAAATASNTAGMRVTAPNTTALLLWFTYTYRVA